MTLAGEEGKVAAVLVCQKGRRREERRPTLMPYFRNVSRGERGLGLLLSQMGEERRTGRRKDR